MTQGEEEPDAERPLAIVDQLPRRVIDGGDVVGVESVAHAERKCQHASAESEEARFRDVVVMSDGGRQHSPTQDVEPDDGQDHPAHPQPLLGGEAVAELGQAGRGDRFVHGGIGHMGLPRAVPRPARYSNREQDATRTSSPYGHHQVP